LFALVALCCFGCKPQDPKARMRDSARHYNEYADFLTTLKDARGFQAAKPTLKKIFAWDREQQREQQRQEQQPRSGGRMPTDAEIQTAMKAAADVMNSPEFQEVMKASFRYGGEIARCQMEIPGFKQFYEQEMGPRNQRR
jgi:hypothetical protein